MSALFAALDTRNAWIGLVPAGAVVVALIINVSSLRTKDMNRKAGIATNLLFVAMLIEAAAWTVRSFGGGNEVGVFWFVVGCAFLHALSAVVALWAWWEFRTHGRWPYGRRRAGWGFWLNIIALLLIAAWFYLGLNPGLYRRIFE